jgi:hypothetical protein
MQPEQHKRKEFEDQPGGPEKEAGLRAMTTRRWKVSVSKKWPKIAF